MKVERKFDTHEQEYERTVRPDGSRISYSQLSTPCDLRLKFRRQRVEASSPLSIGLIYGRAFHAGIEAFLRGAAKTPLQASRAALAALDEEVHKNQRSPGIRWDAYHERNQDGSCALKGNNFGSLPDITFARWWMVRQVPLWIAIFGHSKVRFSEKSIYVPLTPQPGWKTPWSVECWLDFILDVEGGYQVTDTKTAAGRWDDRDIRKNSKQAMLYMAAASRELGEPPARPFQFQILPRTKAAVPPLELALAWASSNDWDVEGGYATVSNIIAGGPPQTKTVILEGKGKKAVKAAVPVLDADGQPVQEWTLDDALQVVEVPYDLRAINTYIHGVIRPKIALIEAEAFVANPSGWHCSESFCDYWSHCRFGSGDNL